MSDGEDAWADIPLDELGDELDEEEPEVATTDQQKAEHDELIRFLAGSEDGAAPETPAGRLAQLSDADFTAHLERLDRGEEAEPEEVQRRPEGFSWADLTDKEFDDRAEKAGAPLIGISRIQEQEEKEATGAD
jgi:hypothetical protein